MMTVHYLQVILQDSFQLKVYNIKLDFLQKKNRMLKKKKNISWEIFDHKLQHLNVLCVCMNECV